MSEIVRVKYTEEIGSVECYEGNGEYIINLENGTQGLFREGELEFLNFEPYPNTHYKAMEKLILMVSNTKRFECMDIDNEGFIDFICEQTGLSREEYIEIMGLEEDAD